MNLEFKKGSGSIDPWSFEKLLSLGRNPIVTDDFVTWVRVENNYTFRVLSDTESRISSGEDPVKVLMDALETWRPGIKKKYIIHGETIEIGFGDVDPKTKWGYMSLGISHLTTGMPRVWVYYGDNQPFKLRENEYLKFIEDIQNIPANKEELDEIITVWSWK